MNVVMLIPTGIGCEIGGHAGDGCPAAKLLGECCDKLILHPNVVNASDINEMPPNALYVEGSILDRFLEGTIELQEVRQNKILLVVNSPVRNETINAVSAARATMGANIEIVELRTELRMKATMDGPKASGIVRGWQELCEQIQQYDFDAIAIASQIDCDIDRSLAYYRSGGVNPWGKVEALASRLIAEQIGKPTAHAPVEADDPELKIFNEVVDSRISAEAVSFAYLHCVLKGLHKAPRIVDHGLSVRDVDVMITPIGCVGTPHHACLKAGIPIIAVKENTCVLNDPMPDEFILVDNYLEAAGILMAMRAGISRQSVRRPLAPTKIERIHNVG